MADQQVPTQEVTSPTPTTKQKNPKRVAAGKAIAARTKLAPEAQKKALIEAQSIIEKKADPQPVAENVLSTTQWLSVIMAECHQHCRFIGGDLLQARRDQRLFNKKAANIATSPSTIA